MNDRGRIVTGILAAPGRILEDRGAQRVVRVGVGSTDALVDHVVQRTVCLPLNRHADFDEDRNDPGILADGPVPHRAHPRVDQDLRHRILRRWVLLHFPGAVNRLHKIQWVIVGDELQCIGDTVDEILLFDDRHNGAMPPFSVFTAYPACSLPPHRPRARRCWH